MGSSALTCKGNTEIIVDIKGVDKKYTCNAVEGAENIDAQQCYQRAKELCDMVIARRGVDLLVEGYLNLWGGNNRKNKEFVWGATSVSDVDFKHQVYIAITLRLLTVAVAHGYIWPLIYIPI